MRPSMPERQLWPRRNHRCRSYAIRLADLAPGLGHHLLDAARGGIPLVRGGVDPAVPREQAGRALEYPQMMVQTRRQLRIFGWIALQHGVAADDAVPDLIRPEHTAV